MLPRPVGRGRLVATVLTAVCVLGLPACGGGNGDDTAFQPVEGQPFAEPRRLESASGELAARLVVAEGTLGVAGASVQGKSYDGTFPGPTMVVSPGDTIRLELVNEVDEPTNIHFHGFHTSPSGIADNVLRTIDPRTTAPVVVPVPSEMSPGLYWYHSHEHGISEEQVFTGLSGAIVVRGLEQKLPADLQRVTQRVFTLKDVQVKDGAIVSDNINSDAPTTRTVNGIVQPTLDIAPGETQLWRFANIGADIWYNLTLGGQTFKVVAEDANPVGQVWQATELLLPPGKRYEVLVQGPPAGTYQLQTLAYSTGAQGDSYPQALMATVQSTGPPVPPAALPQSLGSAPDLASTQVDRQREFSFSENEAGTQFYINGEQFDHDRINVEATLGDVEEWTIKNVSGEEHPFHIHINDFQVMSINGQPYQARSLQDTVPLPAGGEVVIRQQFTDYTGEWVYHCHILAHEDNGMMGLIQVSEPGAAPPADPASGPTIE